MDRKLEHERFISGMCADQTLSAEEKSVLVGQIQLRVAAFPAPQRAVFQCFLGLVLGCLRLCPRSASRTRNILFASLKRIPLVGQVILFHEKLVPALEAEMQFAKFKC